jgi:hypothetical protein
MPEIGFLTPTRARALWAIHERGEAFEGWGHDEDEYVREGDAWTLASSRTSRLRIDPGPAHAAAAGPRPHGGERRVPAVDAETIRRLTARHFLALDSREGTVHHGHTPDLWLAGEGKARGLWTMVYGAYEAEYRQDAAGWRIAELTPSPPATAAAAPAAGSRRSRRRAP